MPPKWKVIKQSKNATNSGEVIPCMNSNTGQGYSRQLHGVYIIASALVQQVVGGEEKQRRAGDRAELVGEIPGDRGVGKTGCPTATGRNSQ